MAQLRTFPAQLTDKTYEVKTNPNRFDSFWLKRMRDPRDLPFIYLTMKLLAIVLPCVVIMYGFAQIPWLFWPTAARHRRPSARRRASMAGPECHAR